MYLKRIELQGFKSFADKTVLEFLPGITTVIGPNGSGKSNISDAIRWVLGEQSMKSLRGSKTEDIIFAGTQNRKSLGFAEVSMVIDNTDQKLPIEYNEVTVTRKIYRNGESGYYINKAPCRLKDIFELFMDTGIGKDGYSIIGQGKIDEILSNKSEERRHIFEEAAGIVKYRVRKQESEKKLEQTKLNLLRINDIITEIEANIEPTKLQSEKAKEFLRLRDELKSIEIGLFIHNINDYKAKIGEIINNQDIFNTQLIRENERLSNIQELKEELKDSIDNVTVQIEQMQNLGFENDKKKEQLNSNINLNLERISNNKENFERLEKEISENSEKLTMLEEEKNQKQDKKTNLRDNKDKFVKELEEKELEFKKLTDKMSEKELEIESKKKKVDKNTDERYEISNTISTLVANAQNAQARKKAIKEEITSSISELDSSRMNKSEISQKFAEIEAKRNKIKNDLDAIEDKRKEANTKLKEYDLKINQYESEMRIKDSRLKFLVETEKEKEGYIRSVKSILQDCDKDASLKKGVHGVIANLISVPKEYETAIEMSLGQAMQNIVTDTEEDAKKLVEHLRKFNLGRASFLPITSVKGKKLDKIKSATGVIGIASDLVKFDKKYEDVILSLLGRTLVVDTMDNAIAIARKNAYGFRIVTIQGDILNPSGAISGGSVSQKTVNILGRSREIEDLKKEISGLKNKIQKLSNEKEEYEKSIENILTDVQNLENQLKDIEIIYATEKQKVVSIEEAVSKIETRLNKFREEDKAIDEQLQINKDTQEELNAKVKAFDEENAKLNEEIREFAEANKDTQKYADDLNFDITNLKISVSSFDESEASIDELVERINLDIENINKSTEYKNEQKTKILDDNKKLEELNLELKVKIEELVKEVSSSGNKVEELKKERISKNTKLVETEENLSTQMEKIDDLKEQVNKADIKKSKFEVELEQIVTKMWEEYEITPNEPGEYEEPKNVADVQRRVTKLRFDMKALGSVNIDSIEEYRKLKERYDFMSEQRLDLETTISKLRKVIMDMTDTMKIQFEERFRIINKNFSEVFTELFGGGKAELKLTDQDNILESGIEIEVQPPGKKLQNMMLLSGGERAFTAIALLFAILKINPAPFCVLDEIEAALDDVNVYRFAEYLKKFSSNSQFLVITHRKGTMEAANTVYGITMEENGISKLLSLDLKKG
ncbi:MAG: chromosome segregation protein SMC [Clostridia bacterium]|nr:chromosome segregation protein SMC [Clostridia bacterium]